MVKALTRSSWLVTHDDQPIGYVRKVVGDNGPHYVIRKGGADLSEAQYEDLDSAVKALEDTVDRFSLLEVD